MSSILREAIDAAGGPAVVGPACGRTYQAALKWYRKGRLPRTDWTGETRYAEILEELTKGQFTKSQLLGEVAA